MPTVLIGGICTAAVAGALAAGGCVLVQQLAQARLQAAFESAAQAKEARFRRLRWTDTNAVVELPSLAVDAFHIFLSCARSYA